VPPAAAFQATREGARMAISPPSRPCRRAPANTHGRTSA
jgi:hypothetical protein